MFQKIIRSICRVLAWSFVVGLVIQVYLAGLGVFQYRNFSYGEEGARSFYGLHIDFGWILILVTILLLAFAFVARYPRPIIVRAVALFVLMAIQVLILWVDQTAALIRAFHPVNAIALGWTGISLAKRVSNVEEQSEKSLLSAKEQSA